MFTVVFAPQVWLAAPQLDVRLARGEDPFSSRALALHAVRLVSRRLREQLADGVEDAFARQWAANGLSAAVPVDHRAVTIAAPALEQLVEALRSRERPGVRGLALGRLLVTDPGSALYAPQYPEELYERAREALLAL